MFIIIINVDEQTTDKTKPIFRDPTSSVLECQTNEKMFRH